jgi:hypothetical protein
MLGFRARNQHIRAHSELQPEEFLLTGNVLDGFVARSAREPTLIDFRLSRVQLRFRMRQQKSAIPTHHVHQQ